MACSHQYQDIENEYLFLEEMWTTVLVKIIIIPIHTRSPAQQQIAQVHFCP